MISTGGGGGISNVTIQDDGVTEGNVTTLNFTGVDVIVANGVATIPIGAAGTAVDGNISAQQIIELINNRHNNTYVANVVFTATPTAIGAGDTVTLSITAIDNPNAYDIIWGDGSTTIGTASSSPSHVYSNIAGQPFTVNVRAYNTAGIGYGSSASFERVDYITAFAANPTAGFELFRALTGGIALSGNQLYAIENEPIYLDNDSTNTAGATVTYEVTWGDGNTTTVNDDTDPGGVSGNRLSHTYGTSASSGTGTLPVKISITAHSTANPSLLPIVSTTKQLKVYDTAISAPDGLSSKTVSFSGSTGNSPKLVSGFTDRTNGASSLLAGATVSRTVANTGSIDTTTTSTYAYDANTGILSTSLNGQETGNIAFTTGSDVGTNGSAQVVAESDYNLLNSGGSSIAFSQSVYYPGLYRGFTCKISQSASAVSLGLNRLEMGHSTTGNVTPVDFVKDDLTVAPTIAGGVVSEQTSGTYRFISGVPYYNSGSPALRLSGVGISNLTGQTYADITNVMSVNQNSLLENTSGSIIATQNYTYTNINDSGNPLLSSGVPIANIGRTNSYSVANLSIPITTSQVSAVANLNWVARNVTGTSNQINNTVAIQVHTAQPSGIVETAVSVSAALGNGTFTDAGVRSFAFSGDTSDTPSFNSATNFFTTAVYNAVADPGVSGTREATIRWGVIRNLTTNFSSGFLPVGPDRSGDAGVQYFTFAFRRQVVANFSISISSTTGIVGVWIAAPGTSIDSTSTLNGWLDCSAAYAGAGVPGGSTANGGNGSNGCASTTGDRIPSGVAISGNYSMTLGSENLTNATNNVCLVRIALGTNQTVTQLSIG